VGSAKTANAPAARAKGKVADAKPDAPRVARAATEKTPASRTRRAQPRRAKGTRD
jgi:hypothetical protein